MKKRQQQEIVVSGLNINTSDISSELEEEAVEADEAVPKSAAALAVENTGSVEHLFLQDEGLINLIEPAVRKVGGGGAVSLSAFQVGLFPFHPFLIKAAAG